MLFAFVVSTFHNASMYYTINKLPHYRQNFCVAISWPIVIIRIEMFVITYPLAFLTNAAQLFFWIFYFNPAFWTFNLKSMIKCAIDDFFSDFVEIAINIISQSRRYNNIELELRDCKKTHIPIYHQAHTY